MPDSSGSSVPAVRPNEWNSGSAFKITSCELKSMRAATCSRLASTFACDSATPFGMPSEPDVNSTIAVSSGTHALARVLQRGEAARDSRLDLEPRRDALAQVLEIDDGRDLAQACRRDARASLRRRTAPTCRCAGSARLGRRPRGPLRRACSSASPRRARAPASRTTSPRRRSRSATSRRRLRGAAFRSR